MPVDSRLPSSAAASRRARRELQVRWRLPTHGDFWTRVKELCFFFDAKDADCVRKLGQLCEGWAEYSARGVEVASTAALLKVVLSFLEEQLDACSTILLATPSAGSASEDATVDHADVRMCVDGVPTPADVSCLAECAWAICRLSCEHRLTDAIPAPQVRAAASAAVTCARDIVAGASGRPENDRFAPSVLLWSCKSWVGPFDSRRRPALAYLCAILRRLAMGVDGVGGAKSQAEARQGTALESLAVAWVAGLVEACKVLPPAAAERGVAVESLMGLLRVPRLLDVCPALRSEASVDLWVALLGSPAPLRADGGTPRVVLRNLLALSAVALPHVHARLAESIRDLQSRRARVVQRTGSLARSSMDLAEDSAAHSELVAVSVRAGARLCNALVTLEVAALQKGPGDDGGAVGAAISDLDQPGLLKPLIQVCLWPGWMATCADLAAEGSDLPRADHQAVQHLCEASGECVVLPVINVLPCEHRVKALPAPSCRRCCSHGPGRTPRVGTCSARWPSLPTLSLRCGGTTCALASATPPPGTRPQRNPSLVRGATPGTCSRSRSSRTSSASASSCAASRTCACVASPWPPPTSSRRCRAGRGSGRSGGWCPC